jgi:prepilin-type processing-associated H-X9-DG protein
MMFGGIISKADVVNIRKGCPSNSQQLQQTCYAYNANQLGTANSPEIGYRKILEVQQPSNTIEVSDGSSATQNNGKRGIQFLIWWAADYAPGGQYSPLGHSNGRLMNILWVDGHVSTEDAFAVYNGKRLNDAAAAQNPPYLFARRKDWAEL